MGKSAPRAPDPAETAAAQGAMNRDTAITQNLINSQDQHNPWGSVTYAQDGTRSYTDASGNLVQVPNMVQTTTYNPDQQAIFDSTTAAQGNLANLAQTLSGNLQGALGQNYTGANLGQIQTDLGQSNNIGGGYNTQFNGNIGGNFTNELGPNYATSANLAQSYAGADDFSADRDAYTNALLARNSGNRSQTEAQLRTTLANKGIREGSAAWNQEMERLARQNTDEQYAAMLAGGQEQARMVQLAREAAQFGNDAQLAQLGFGNNAALTQAQFGNSASMDQANFANTAQSATNAAAMGAAGFGNQANAANAQFNNAAVNQQLAQDLAIRNQPVNEISALLSSSQVANPAAQSGATPQASVAGVDYSGLVQQNYQNQLANYQSGLGGIGGLFGSVLGAAGQAGGFGALFSDRRLKKNVQHVGETEGGHKVYSYNYIWGGPTHIGVMAQEVPHAAVAHESGFLMVDYSEVK